MYGQRMPFGKWEGYLVEAVPSDYLLWVVANLHDLKPWLRQNIIAELRSRGVNPHQRQGQQTPRTCTRCQSAEDRLRQARETFTRLYRQLSLAIHPDRGGDTRAMALLNECSEQMTAALGGNN